MIEKYLWATGSFILMIMGTLHLYGTLFTPFMHPRNEKLIPEMKLATLKMSDKLTLWKSWIGFNATHSAGVIFLGASNLYITSKYGEILQHDLILPSLTIVVVSFYCWVAWRYWFKIVTSLLVVALIFLLTSFVLIIFHA